MGVNGNDEFRYLLADGKNYYYQIVFASIFLSGLRFM